MSDRPTLMLGTAMWGWTVSRPTSFALLDAFYEAGFRWVDAATNYPINKQAKDFRLSENILAEWIRTNGINDLKVIMKIGSINNMRGPENNLKKSFVLMCLDEYVHLLGSNLHTLMIHWDNRDNKEEISETLEGMAEAHRLGIQTGLSGIKHPQVYAQLKDQMGEPNCIEIKHNLFYSDYSRYQDFHGARRFITYGINGGGIKLDAGLYSANSSLKARGRSSAASHPIIAPLNDLIQKENKKGGKATISKLNHCGLIYSYYSPDILGILIGPSSPEQMQDSIQFFQLLEASNYQTFFQELLLLKDQYAS